MSSLTKCRRRPVQNRSIRTVAHILDAARSLLARIPFAEVTTTRIAAEPGVSVGALYRFFPDKASIIDAIVERHIVELRRQIDRDFRWIRSRELRSQPGFDFGTVVKGVVNLYAAYLDQHADFRTISFERDPRELSPLPGIGARSGLNAMLTEAAFLQLGVNFTPEIDRKLKLASEAGERLMAYAHEQPIPERRDEIIAEAKKMLARYLTSAFGN